MRTPRVRSVLTALAAAALASSAAVTGAPPAAAADPQTAPTPPMGWNSWNTFGCDISESKIRAAADALVSSGMRDAGYTYVVVDDCWQDSSRDADGQLRADPTRFSSGMKALGDYIHSKGLEFGIYQAPWEKTCAQYFGATGGATGALGHEQQDANTFASWGVDYLKYDWCSPDGSLQDQIDAFTLMGDALRATGRPIVYSINPNSVHADTGPEYDWGQISTMVRTTEDITDRWATGCTGDCFRGFSEIVDVQAPLWQRQVPGAYNDPDMLEVGVRGSLTPTENRSHLSMWAVMGSPLMAGNDVTSMDADTRWVLTNPDVIAIDQDRDAKQGQRVRDDGDTEVWAKPLSDGSVAVALFNRGSAARAISTTAAEVGLPSSSSYGIFDTWTKGTTTTTGTIAASVPSHGAALLRVTPGSAAQTTYGLRGTGSGRCLDALGGAADDGTAAVIWDCNGGTGQRYATSSIGQLQMGGKCLDVSGGSTADGAAVVFQDCTEATSQRWTSEADGTVRNQPSGKCLDVDQAATAGNSRLVIWTCAATSNQTWSKV